MSLFFRFAIVLLTATGLLASASAASTPAPAPSQAPTGASADTEGDAVLGKYRAFVGWTLGDSGVQNIRIAGQIANLSKFDEICETNRFAQFNVGSTSGRPFLVGGERGSIWVSHAGQPKNLPDEVAQDAYAQSLLLCNAFASYHGTVVTEIAPAGTNSKSGYAVVAIQPPNGPVILLSINKETGELTSVVVNKIATYELADLKPIDAGRKIYTRWKRMLPDGSSADMTISRLQLNVKVDPAIFSRQAQDVAPPPDPASVITF